MMINKGSQPPNIIINTLKFSQPFTSKILPVRRSGLQPELSEPWGEHLWVIDGLVSPESPHEMWRFCWGSAPEWGEWGGTEEGEAVVGAGYPFPLAQNMCNWRWLKMDIHCFPRDWFREGPWNFPKAKNSENTALGVGKNNAQKGLKVLETIWNNHRPTRIWVWVRVTNLRCSLHGPFQYE